MQVSPQSEKPLDGAESAPNAVEVRGQLRRLLAHPLFKHSKRYPVLLAYTVEQALEGNASELKERTIGVEAFGRAPDYDVNLDPVVRMTAAEVRKRLSQYYYNPAHDGELVIELPVGSYIPYFREAPTSPTVLAAPSGSAEKIVAFPQELVAPRVGPADGEPTLSGFMVRHWISEAIVLLCAALIGFGIGRVKFSAPATNLERFWEPITATSSRVTYCLGDPGDGINRERITPPGAPLFGGLDLSDVTTLVHSIVPLVPRNGAFRILPASNTEFTQLREGPFVLIGAYNNSWTMRITQDLPFGFEVDNNEFRVVDHKSAHKIYWAVPRQGPNAKQSQDYAIVARIHDNLTGQPVIILAGILREGTEAAGEVVSNPLYLDAMLRKAPKSWEQLNLEAVIGTHVIEGQPGPPTVVAVDTW